MPEKLDNFFIQVDNAFGGRINFHHHIVSNIQNIHNVVDPILNENPLMNGMWNLIFVLMLFKTSE